MARIVYDIEANGLYQTVSKFHCGVTIDIDTGEVNKYRPHQLHMFIDAVNNADLAVAHNGIGYDVPTLEKLSGLKVRKDNQFDTLVASRLIWPNIGDKDTVLVRRYRKLAASGQDVSTWNRPVLLPRLFGSHSLKAWGYRLQEFKGDFSEDTDWQTFSEAMLDYCEQDCVVTLKLYKTVCNRLHKDLDEQQINWDLPLNIEHRIAWSMAQQERNGFYFDERAAVKLYGDLAQRRNELKDELTAVFGSWYVSEGITTPKRTINYRDVLKPSTVGGARFTKVKRVEFNPASRDHIAHVLRSRYNWEPQEMTEGGKPKVDESVLSKLDYPEAKLLCEYFMLQKRLGQLSEGKQGWLNAVTDKGFIHGSINPCGAVTGRATHSSPNIAQVPSSNAPYGHECRSLFTVPDGFELLGADASGLELRCLGHFMARWDNGAYIKEILEGDIHWANAQSFGLVKAGTKRYADDGSKIEENERIRGVAKTLILTA